jgi:hypothetical protein
LTIKKIDEEQEEKEEETPQEKEQCPLTPP